MSSRIKKEEALKMITAYKATVPANALKSAWLDKDVVEFIKENADKMHITGIRAYLGLDAKGVTNIILAPTTQKGKENVDIENGYFDLSRPCPPYCDGGIAS